MLKTDCFYFIVLLVLYSGSKRVNVHLYLFLSEVSPETLICIGSPPPLNIFVFFVPLFGIYFFHFILFVVPSGVNYTESMVLNVVT